MLAKFEMTQKVHSHKERKDSLKTRVEPVFYLCNGKSKNYKDPLYASLHKKKKRAETLHSLCWLENAWWELLKFLTVTIFFFKIGIHFMPGWTATSHEVKKKEAQKDQSSVSKEPTYNRCLLILHFKPFRS